MAWCHVFGVFIDDFLVVGTDDAFYIFNARVAYSAVCLLKIICSLIDLGKWLSTKLSNCFATLVTIFL